MKSKIVTVLLVSSLLSGCAFRQELRGIAVNHNKMIADTANEITLLNILRARDRLPMHFTRMTGLNGDVGVKASGGATFGLPELSDHTVSPTYSASISSNPSFSAAVLDGQKFQNGIQKPLDASTVIYYLKAGWPDELLAALFIEKVEVLFIEDVEPPANQATVSSTLPKTEPQKIDEVDTPASQADVPSTVLEAESPNKGDVIAVINNDPGIKSSFGGFLCKYRLVPSSVKQEDTQLFKLTEAMFKNFRLPDIGLLDGTKYDVSTSAGEKFISRKGGSQDALALELAGEDRCPKSAYTAGEEVKPKFSKGENRLVGEHYKKDNVVEVGVDNEFYLTQLDGSKIKIRFQLTMRSVQDVIYFLGEYVRKHNNGKKTYNIGRRTTNELKSYEIIRLFKGGSEPKAAISANYMGSRYYASSLSATPHQHGDRTTTTISLVQQLLNLHKSADDLPRANTLTVVGRQ